jgi:hypothetical protein
MSRLKSIRFCRIPAHKLHDRHRPRGMAVVMVLGLLAITLAISYATLRGQGTTSQLARNSTRALDARVAAQSGLAAAVRKISENSWGGVDTQINSNVTNHSWYQVSFTTGDAKLVSTDPQYGEYPFRVTIDSVGYAADPLNAAVRAQHKSRCVVQLVRKKLLSEPAIWPTLTNNTVYQYSSQDAFVQFPVRIAGAATLHGRLRFCTEYPNHTASRDQYLSDLNLRRIAGLGDDRPFPSTMTLRGLVTVQDSPVVTTLTTSLGMVLLDTAAGTSAPVSHPGSVTTYRLYPGGKEYTTPVLQSTYGNPLSNVTVAPDPVSNPLGVYRSVGSLTLGNNVNITGTIITHGSGPDIQVSGTGIELKAFNLPSLYGSNLVYQLPVALVNDDIRVTSGSDAKITGMTVVWDDFELISGAASTKFEFKGNLITDTLQLRGRTSWAMTPAQWNTDRLAFIVQLLLGTPYFPDYQQSLRGFTVKPALTFSPDSSGVKPQWHNWTQPVYQADPADPGLRWEVVRWEDNL